MTTLAKPGARVRTGLACAGALLVALGLAGCSPGQVEKEAGEAVAGSAAPAGEGAGRDLSGGGTCTDGEAVTIATEGATPVITGGCGTVTISADKVRGNIESAQSVTISGAGVSVLGDDWKSLSIAGAESTANVDRLGTVAVSGDGVHVTNDQAKSVTLDGDSATVNTDGIETLVVNGSGNTVVVNGKIGALTVNGSDNTFNWDSGAKAPAADNGSGNTYTR